MAAKKKLTAAQIRVRIAGLEKTLRTGKKSDGTKLAAKNRPFMERMLKGLKAKLSGKKPAKKAAKKAPKRSAKRAAKRAAKKPAKRGAKKAAKRGAKRSAKRGAKKSAKKPAKRAAKRSAKKPAKRGAKRTGRKPLTTRKGGIAAFERAIIGRVAKGPLPSAIKIEEIYTRPRKKTTRRKPARRGRR